MAVRDGQRKWIGYQNLHCIRSECNWFFTTSLELLPLNENTQSQTRPDFLFGILFEEFNDETPANTIPDPSFKCILAFVSIKR